ncbi:MAG: methionine ABC transporter permease [Tissierellia bacterium]|nr:methionine ABC transporter permease [Tissierellia bacterium]
MIETIIKASQETLYMVFVSALLAVILGLPLAVILFTSQEGGLRENKTLFRILDTLINIFRSLPFIILMIIVRPLSSLIVGKSIGPTAAIVPLTIAAIPFIARLFEGSFSKIDKGIIEAAKSMGSSRGQIIKKVLIPEAFPNIVNDITMTLINLVGYSAMAGSIGGGGLGNLAVRYGVYNYKFEYLIIAVIIIIILVQLIQVIGTSIYKKINKI